MINWKVQSYDKGLSDGQKVAIHDPESPEILVFGIIFTWKPARLVTAQSIRVDRPRVTVWMLPLVLTNQRRVLLPALDQSELSIYLGWRKRGLGVAGVTETGAASASGGALLNSSQKFLLNPG